MPSEVDPADTLQDRTVRAFTVLHTLKGDWGGALILCCGLGPHGAALALASNIAGAVCLSIEEDAKTLKAAMRAGACDFAVNTVDEALRTMKNEVRKHQPLSVALEGDPATVLAELLARGVAPELCTSVTWDPGYHEALLQFQSSGALLVDFDNSAVARISHIEGAVDGNALLDDLAAEKQWQLLSFPFSDPAGLRAFDAQALSIIPAEDQLRRKWLLAAPRILPRERPLRRALWLAEEENDALQHRATPRLPSSVPKAP